MMILVTGGSYQGKIEFVKRHFGLSDEDIADAQQPLDVLLSAACIRHIERLADNYEECIGTLRRILKERPDIIMVIDEIGCGIIPIEKSERIYRENSGRTGCFIAERADTVIRVVCGIPMVIKGELP